MTRILVVQPALPSYRHDFFDRLHRRYGDAFVVAYSPTSLDVLTSGSATFPWAKQIGPLRSVAPGLDWQVGALRLPISRGDIVVVSGAPRTLSTLVLTAKARLRGARTVWWGHYWSATTRTWRFLLRLLLMRAADAILFYTDAEVLEYRSSAGAHDSRPVKALNNGLPLEQIRAHRRPYVARERGEDVLFIGRVTEKCRLDLLLEVMACPDGPPGLTLHVIGSGPHEPFLRARAAELGLRERVAWHGATVDEARIAAVANRCRAFVYPGEVGLSLIHAMAYGLPAIVPGNRWQHGPEFAAFGEDRTGRSFRAGDAAELSRVLGAVLTDTEALDRLSRGALSVTEASFNTDDMERRFADLLDLVSVSR